MREIMKKLYQSIVEEIPDLYEEIYFGVQDKKIKLQLEDIFPLCQFSIYDSESMQCSDILDITRMVFWAIEEGDLEEGFKELIKVLEFIYNNVDVNTRTYWNDKTAESYIYTYLMIAISRYKEDELTLLGKVISKNQSNILKKDLKAMLKRCIHFNEDEDGIIENGNLLLENIKI